MGVKYKAIDLYASDAAQINPTFTYSLGDPDFPDSIPYKAQFVKPVTGVTGVSGEVRSKSKQYGVFIQDDWQVNDHLQLNIGLRWDYEKTPSYLDFVTPQQVVDAIYSQDPRAPLARPMPIRWHWAAWTSATTSATATTARRSRTPGSRAWASYDINADEQHVIHGGAGRSYDRDLFDNLQLETTKLAPAAADHLLPQPGYRRLHQRPGRLL